MIVMIQLISFKYHFQPNKAILKKILKHRRVFNELCKMDKYIKNKNNRLAHF
jgi:hypothetical protein